MNWIFRRAREHGLKNFLFMLDRDHAGLCQAGLQRLRCPPPWTFDTPSTTWARISASAMGVYRSGCRRVFQTPGVGRVERHGEAVGKTQHLTKKAIVGPEARRNNFLAAARMQRSRACHRRPGTFTRIPGFPCTPTPKCLPTPDLTRLTSAGWKGACRPLWSDAP